ncbi:acyl-CoA dehydrogenase family protein [Glaciecola sp. 1036]|uniref:acyl-CoA dehydrogenase family protein n=1 Tax=Alteromonadaceae TaxID=72275 RepID=UPI003CFBD1C4
MSSDFQPDYRQTHQVFNQPSPLSDYNAYASDRILSHWIKNFDGEWGETLLTDYGQLVGGSLQQAGFDANKYTPEFTPHDRFGHRVDLVNYHPAYHQLMTSAIAHGHTWLPWKEQKMGAHVVRAGIEFLHTQADPGSGCPLTMTFASVPALQHQPSLAEHWIPKILSNQYDHRNIPYFEKNGLTIGMAMTEKQGGSDVRANTSWATATGKDESGTPIWEIVGHKWFCSAPMCDGFLVTANTEGGITCFLMPRWRPDGSKNPIQIQRLKDKAGNTSNASSEVEFRGAFAWQVGAIGKGIKTILEMVAMTRFDCMVGSSSLLALATQQALHHTKQRKAFGKYLHDQPLMQNVLADLALESEAALAITMRMAKALDNQEDALIRLGTAIGKYWICKRASLHTAEAMECIGAVGLIKDNVLARLYTESPVNAIWEGSGNVQCLDVLRVIHREPEALTALLNEIEIGSSLNLDLKVFIEDLKIALTDIDSLEYNSRNLVEKLALAWQASTMLQHGDKLVAEAFIKARLCQHNGLMFGTLPPGIDCMYIINRALPQL